MTYKFKYRRRFFWKTEVVAGHRYDKDQDKMILYFADGSLIEIARWASCQCRLGTDWVLFVKRDMEKQAGTPVQLEV